MGVESHSTAHGVTSSAQERGKNNMGFDTAASEPPPQGLPVRSINKTFPPFPTSHISGFAKKLQSAIFYSCTSLGMTFCCLYVGYVHWPESIKKQQTIPPPCQDCRLTSLSISKNCRLTSMMECFLGGFSLGIYADNSC